MSWSYKTSQCLFRSGPFVKVMVSQCVVIISALTVLPQRANLGSVLSLLLDICQPGHLSNQHGEQYFSNRATSWMSALICAITRFAMQQKCIYRLIHQPRTQPQLKEGNIRRNDENISARQMSSWYIVSCLRSGCNLTPTFSLAGEIANVAAENWWGVLDVVNSYHVPTFVRYCFGFEDNLFYYPNQWSSGTFK